MVLVNATAEFSPDYSTARHRFREAAGRLGWKLEAHPIDATGPNAEQLTIDVALSPGNGSEQALVVSSGVHGVEGFFGSAIQLGLLEQWSIQPGSLPVIRCLFLHGLDPFGFAWLRRFDEKNVDLNRNFLLEGEKYAGSPAEYAGLDSLLNPKRPPSTWEPFALKALFAIARHGMPALKQAVAAGQYEFSKGLFYGGPGPSRANQLLGEKLGRWLEGCRDVVHLDFHTGLGPWASCKLLLDYTPTDGQRARLVNWFGPGSFEANDSRGVAYRTRGGFGQWCVARSGVQQYLFACAEFGTYGPIHVVGSLRAENQAHHWGKAEDRSTQQAKQRLSESFCPGSPVWRQRALKRGFELVEQALKGMMTQVSA